jgi:hypothetical protein
LKAIQIIFPNDTIYHEFRKSKFRGPSLKSLHFFRLPRASGLSSRHYCFIIINYWYWICTECIVSYYKVLGIQYPHTKLTLKIHLRHRWHSTQWSWCTDGNYVDEFRNSLSQQDFAVVKTNILLIKLS